MSNKSKRGLGLFSSIRTRLLVYFFLLFVVTILSVELTRIYGIPFTDFNGEYAVEQSRVLRKLAFVADLKKERLMRWFKERIDDSTVISKSLIVTSEVVDIISAIEEGGANVLKSETFWAELKNTQAQQALIQYLETVKITYGVYEEISIYDFKSLTAISSTNYRKVGRDVLPNSEVILGNIEYEDVIVSTRSEEGSGKVSLIINHSILANNQVVAVLAMSVNTNDVFGPMIHVGLGLGITGEVFLVDQDVNILTSLRHPLPDGTRPRPLEYKIKAKPAYFSAMGEEGIVVTDDYRGIIVLAAYRHLNLTPDVSWGMVVKEDRSEVFDPFKARLVYAVYILMIGVLFLAIAIWIITKKLTAPIVSLSLTALKVEAGDLQARALVSTRDEVGALTETFNSMVAKVAERTLDLETANLELKSLSRLKSMFIASMSHELRTPLNSIIGFTGILLKGMAGELNEEQTRQLTLVKSSSNHLLSLINDIIDVSKIETDKVEFFIEEFDIVGQLDEIKDTFAIIVEEKGLALSIDAPDKLLVASDERRVRQIVVNLVSNALKFTESGEIKISLCKNGDTLEVSVDDTGVGIIAEDIEMLFLPFSRIAQKGKIVEGSGLGLYLSQKLAVLLGGEIRVESEFGKGSVFTLSLPLRHKEGLS